MDPRRWWACLKPRRTAQQLAATLRAAAAAAAAAEQRGGQVYAHRVQLPQGPDTVVHDCQMHGRLSAGSLCL